MLAYGFHEIDLGFEKIFFALSDFMCYSQEAEQKLFKFYSVISI